MHIAIISHEYPPFIYGGIGTFVKNLASSLSKRGIYVTVLSGYPILSKGFRQTGENNAQDDGVIIKRYSYLNIPPSHTFFQLQNMSKIIGAIKELKPDLIHGQSGSAFPLIKSLRKSVPVITTFHSSPKVEKNISSYSLLRGGTFNDFRTYVLGYPIMSYVYKQEIVNSNMNVAVSKTLLYDLLGEMGNAYRSKVCSIPNAVDIEALDNEIADLDKDTNLNNETITYAGRLFWRKGSLNVVSLARLLQKQKSKYKLIVHGTGPLFKEMNTAIKSCNLSNIELKGFTSRANLLSSIKQSKLVIIPSYYEACPMILLESMCLGKVPVMFDLPFAREFTDNGKYGVLANNVSEMAKKIQQIEYGVEDLKKRSKEVLTFARKQYDMSEVVKAYCSIYQQFA